MLVDLHISIRKSTPVTIDVNFCPQCNGPWGKASDFKLCSAENTNEICFDGDCHELSVTCAAHFWLCEFLLLLS